MERFGSGKLPMSAILAPAITLAEEGFPVAPLSALWWSSGMPQLMVRVGVCVCVCVTYWSPQLMVRVGVCVCVCC